MEIIYALYLGITLVYRSRMAISRYGLIMAWLACPISPTTATKTTNVDQSPGAEWDEVPYDRALTG